METFLKIELAGWMLVIARIDGYQNFPTYVKIEKQLREIKGKDFESWLQDIEERIKDESID